MYSREKEYTPILITAKIILVINYINFINYINAQIILNTKNETTPIQLEIIFII